MTLNASILDLSLIVRGGTAATALANSLDLARHAETWGYKRFWVAEHHNMPGIASAATAVVIGHIAGGTSTIRVGAGGVMLPNHAPLVIAEQFGTLESLYPGRIDLGLGRAPGTDQITSHALRRTLQTDSDQFPRDVLELQGYFRTVEPGQRVRAVPGNGLDVPIWILGSSLFGAQLAAMLGLPYAFASHFAPDALMQAIEMYRSRFEPSEQLAEPYLMAGFNIFGADTKEEAAFLRTSSRQSKLELRRGQPGPMPPPSADFEASLGVFERQMLDDQGFCSAFGTVDDITKGLGDFVQQTGIDEVMVVSAMYEHKARLRSLEIGAEAIRNINGTASDDA
jgi:luciferase family oxidoreductase group 1